MLILLTKRSRSVFFSLTNRIDSRVWMFRKQIYECRVHIEFEHICWAHRWKVYWHLRYRYSMDRGPNVILALSVVFFNAFSHPGSQGVSIRIFFPRSLDVTSNGEFHFNFSFFDVVSFFRRPIVSISNSWRRSYLLSNTISCWHSANSLIDSTRGSKEACSSYFWWFSDKSWACLFVVGW